MYTIELKYISAHTGEVRHFFFPATEIKTARDYYDDAVMCGCTILTWQVAPTDKIHVG